MEIKPATLALSALSHEGRLTIFRLLVRSGDAGMAAGDIARAVGVAPNSLSTNLTILSLAGLIRSRRDGRCVIYRAAYDQMAELLGFLVEDCCQASPAICRPLADVLDRVACCPPAVTGELLA